MLDASYINRIFALKGLMSKKYTGTNRVKRKINLHLLVGDRICEISMRWKDDGPTEMFSSVFSPLLSYSSFSQVHCHVCISNCLPDPNPSCPNHSLSPDSDSYNHQNGIIGILSSSFLLFLLAGTLPRIHFKLPSRSKSLVLQIHIIVRARIQIPIINKIHFELLSGSKSGNGHQ